MVRPPRSGAALAIFACSLSGQVVLPRLTLDEARKSAIQYHPRTQSAALAAGAQREVATEARAPFYPQAAGAFTAVAADHGTALSAGFLQTSSLSSRAAAGVNVSQLLTDFGRTRSLFEAANLRANAFERAAADVRNQILLNVSTAYFQTQAAGRVLEVAQAVLDNRRVTLRQVIALAQSSLRSTLDVLFAEVAVSEAELGLSRARNSDEAAWARLNSTLGSAESQHFILEEQPLPDPLTADVPALVSAAIQNRPDLMALRANRESAHRLALAEKQLRYPTVSVLGAAGGIPAKESHLRSDYAAIGLNVSVPVLNGGLFAAREREAILRAQVADRDVDSLLLAVTEQVRTSWLAATDAFQRLEVTARLADQAAEALRLAQARYDAGLSGIVELNQAQTAQVSASINAANAKYEYLSRRAELDFVTGVIQ
jgi:outer membrane protein